MAMIVKEFKGRNEKEAIDKAIEELGLDRNEIDFEIVESKKAGLLFRGGKVKIRVHVSEEHVSDEGARAARDEDAAAEAAARERQGRPAGEPGQLDEAALEASVLYGEERRPVRAPKAPASGEPLPHEKEILAFAQGLLDRMGLSGQFTVTGREEKRLELDVQSDRSGVLIGKQGKTLEAFQFLVNLAAMRFGADSLRVIIDTQDYRSRRERSLERMAMQAAERVRRNRESTLLEPLNPFERRIVHTTLARRGDVETVSEGDGLYKRIRVIWRGGRDGGREATRGTRRGGRGRERARDEGYERVGEREPLADHEREGRPQGAEE